MAGEHHDEVAERDLARQAARIAQEALSVTGSLLGIDVEHAAHLQGESMAGEWHAIAEFMA